MQGKRIELDSKASNGNWFCYIRCSYDVSSLFRNKMEVEVKDGQTLTDIAIQEYGSLEALPALAATNAIGMTDTLEAGSRLQLPDVSYNRLIQQYCKANDVSPATERGMTDVKLRVFSGEFSPQFN